MVSSCKLHQHHAVRWDQFPSPNEVKIKFVLANKGKLLISLNLCQNILCSIDQRNTHSMQTCSTSKKECFSWHRAHLLFSCIAAWLFPPVNQDPCKNVLLPPDSVSVFLPACNRHGNVFPHIHSQVQLLIINGNITLPIIFNVFLVLLLSL